MVRLRNKTMKFLYLTEPNYRIPHLRILTTFSPFSGFSSLGLISHKVVEFGMSRTNAESDLDSSKSVLSDSSVSSF